MTLVFWQVDAVFSRMYLCSLMINDRKEKVFQCLFLLVTHFASCLWFVWWKNCLKSDNQRCVPPLRQNFSSLLLSPRLKRHKELRGYFCRRKTYQLSITAVAHQKQNDWHEFSMKFSFYKLVLWSSRNLTADSIHEGKWVFANLVAEGTVQIVIFILVHCKSNWKEATFLWSSIKTKWLLLSKLFPKVVLRINPRTS